MTGEPDAGEPFELDYCVPKDLAPPHRAGRGIWSPARLSALVEVLDLRGGPRLAQLPTARISSAWSAMLEDLGNPESTLRRKLSPTVATDYLLSEAGLGAALATIIAGAGKAHIRALIERAESLRDLDRPQRAAIIVLPANVPALAVQVLLPALLAARPVLLKSPSREPWLTAAIVAALHAFEPALEAVVAAVSWPGGERSIEDAIFSGRQIVVYGSRGTCHDLGARGLERPVLHGDSLSIEVISSEVDPAIAAGGIVRDLALFDQRGCLCPDAVYVDTDPRPLAIAIHAELERYSRRWPPGGALPGEALAVQGLRAESSMLGLDLYEHALLDGTVVIDPNPTLRPSPGLRSIRIHRLSNLLDLPELLAPLAGRLQACGLAGSRAFALADLGFEELEFSRIAATGHLQEVAVGWRNGGLDPLEVFARRPTSR